MNIAHGTKQALGAAVEVAPWRKTGRTLSAPAIAGLAALCALVGVGAPDVADAAMRVGLKQVGPSRDGGHRCGGKHPESRAAAKISARRDRTSLRLRVRDARPDTLYTIWLYLHVGSPLTGRPVNALVDPPELPELVETTPGSALIEPCRASADDDSGSRVAASAFRTNACGDARVTFQLDLPLIKDAYPFDEAERDLEELFGEDPPDFGPMAAGVTPGRIFRIVAQRKEA